MKLIHSILFVYSTTRSGLTSLTVLYIARQWHPSLKEIWLEPLGVWDCGYTVITELRRPNAPLADQARSERFQPDQHSRSTPKPFELRMCVSIGSKYYNLPPMNCVRTGARTYRSGKGKERPPVCEFPTSINRNRWHQGFWQ